MGALGTPFLLLSYLTRPRREGMYLVLLLCAMPRQVVSLRGLCLSEGKRRSMDLGKRRDKEGL